jgi:CRISPR-associated protein Csb1
MSSLHSRYDHFLLDGGAAALVIREHLIGIEGAGGAVFPATFAAQEGADRDKSKFQGGYNIDTFSDGKNVCLIDSVGSQANRIEAIFAKPPYAELVPQIVMRLGEKQINLLDAGHRAADALFRNSSIGEELHAAFIAAQKGDDTPLAKIAPTSEVFGVWDSQGGTQAKRPRLIASTIRAFDVRRLTRSANYLVLQRLDYVKEGLLPPAAKGEQYSKNGFDNALASATHGGVIAEGGIRRDATLSLAALRLLKAGGDQEKTLRLRRYIFGLALIALTHPPSVYLRQGCNLVRDPEKPCEFVEVNADGRRTDAKLDHEGAMEYAIAAAKAFGVGSGRSVTFNKATALKEIKGDGGEDAPAPSKKQQKS